MKQLLIIALLGSVLSGAYTSEAALTESSASYEFSPQSKSDRQAAREYRKEQRRARRAEYRAKNGKSDHVRMMRENNKQRKKMDKAARKENCRKWDTNELGDVYGIN